MSKGNFINFCLDWSKHSNQSQATLILNKAKSLIANGSKGVAITYSANYSQTVTIEKTYMSGGWNTQTGGANQAAVISDMLTQLDTTFADLQGKMNIAPISTMPGGTQFANQFKNADFHLGIVASDLSRIGSYLDNGWDVLGWQNQDTVNSKTHPYAVGGGVKKNLPVAVVNLIQDTLIKYHKQSAVVAD